MRRTRMPYLVALVVTLAALLLSTWGTGVSLAQGEQPEPTTTTTTLADPGETADECTSLDRVLDLCLDDGTRCTAGRIMAEVLIRGLASVPVETPCLELDSPWVGLLLLFGAFGLSGTST